MVAQHFVPVQSHTPDRYFNRDWSTTVRNRSQIAVSLLAALTILGMSPASQAADAPAPVTGEVVKVTKLTPEQLRKVNAAGAQRSGAAEGRAVCFQAHVRNKGWSATLCTDGTTPGFTGTVGENKPIDRIKFYVGTTGAMNFNVQAHWAETGTGAERHIAPGGSFEFSHNGGQPIQALRFRSTNESMKAAAHVQGVGWKGTDQWSYDQWIGSIGENRWMEAFWIAI
ncbi:hypothetical protein ACFWPV_16780 [Streptomyces uncialis]|uniref:hypothetical protein n=1 Tax=Streptomyces uncialis TaxID=1048205 RepID=UPI003647176A